MIQRVLNLMTADSGGKVIFGYGYYLNGKLQGNLDMIYYGRVIDEILGPRCVFKPIFGLKINSALEAKLDHDTNERYTVYYSNKP